MSIGRLFTKLAAVETFLGQFDRGPSYAAPVVISCYVQEGTKLVTNGGGQEVVSSADLYAPLTTAPTEPPAAGQLTVDSRVTIGGRKSTVLAAASRDAGPDAGHHVKVSLG